MKKSFIILLSAIVLVASLGVTGAFAFSAYPDYGVMISQVEPDNFFFRVTLSDVLALSSNESLELFNGLKIHHPSSSNFYFSYGGVNSASTITATLSYLYFYFYNGTLRFKQSQTVFPFGVSNTEDNHSWLAISISGSNLTNERLGISLGDGYVSDSDTVGEEIDFSIPAGYAFVIEGPCEILERSYYINNSWNFTSNGNYRVNGSFEKILGSSYIVDGFSPDTALSASQLIQWEALNPNIFGTASYYEFYDNTLVQLNYVGENYVIGYPTLYGFGNSNSRLLYTNSVDMVCHLYLNYTTRPTFRWVALESLSEFTNTGNFHTYSVFRPEEVDSEGNSSEGSGGTVVTPSDSLPSGGGNAGQPPVDEDSSLLGTISRLVNNIKQLLSSAVNAINDLVAEGSQFMRSVAQMFTWLPEQLTSLLIAAFTILVVVGVLKVLWR